MRFGGTEKFARDGSHFSIQNTKKKWKRDCTKAGQRERKKCLEDMFKQQIGWGPIEPGDEKKHKSATRRLKKGKNQDDKESKTTNASDTDLIKGTCISKSTSHIQPEAYRATNESAIVIIQDFIFGHILARDETAGATTSTLDAIESAFYAEGVRIDRVDACFASSDIAGRVCDKITESKHWNRTSWVAPQGNRIARLLTGEVDSITESDNHHLENSPEATNASDGTERQASDITAPVRSLPPMMTASTIRWTESADSGDWNPEIFYRTRYNKRE
jgi:hypothetical protein